MGKTKSNGGRMIPTKALKYTSPTGKLIDDDSMSRYKQIASKAKTLEEGLVVLPRGMRREALRNLEKRNKRK